MAPTKELPALPPQAIPTGTALDPEETTPTLFTPIQLRGITLRNRFVVSPMGTWSAVDGHLTAFHQVHYGAFALRGAALTVVESTAVAANGRTSPHDAGLWRDSQAAPLRRVFDFARARGQRAGVQLNHAGCKSSMLTPRLSPGGRLAVARESDGGWPEDVWAPSAVAHGEGYVVPKALTVEGIDDLVRSFGSAARRAVDAGTDFIEIHGAHGYLIHQFLSPLTNHRTDEYGGSFENRTRFLLRVIRAVRDELPESVPLSLRISATEWMEWSGRPSWDMEQTLRLARLLPAMGVDILDVSSGGNVQEQRIQLHGRYQIDLAGIVRDAMREDGISLLIGAVGLITSPEIAAGIVQEAAGGRAADGSPKGRDQGRRLRPAADLVFIGRQFVREPDLVLNSAQTLGVRMQLPFQYEKARLVGVLKPGVSSEAP